MLAVIGAGHVRRALPRPENGLRDLPALRYVAGLRLPVLGCEEGMIVAWLWKERYIPSGQAESCPGGGYCQPRGRRLLELLL